MLYDVVSQCSVGKKLNDSYVNDGYDGYVGAITYSKYLTIDHGLILKTICYSLIQRFYNFSAYIMLP